MLKHKKRGQITIFIILGIVILLSSAAYFYFKQKTTDFEPKIVTDRKTTVLQPYVEACLELSVKEALGRVSTTGGYIDYPLLIENDPASYLKISPFDEPKMPYWWYAGEDRIPPLDFIKAQMEEYVKNNIDSCLDNFSAIPGYDVYKTGATDVIITFAKSDIAVEMKYPLRAVKIPERNEFSVDDYDFFIQIPIRFREVYDLAKEIMDDENQDYFMESWTTDLISLDDTGESDSTPLMNFDIRLRPYIWQTNRVQNRLKDLLLDNVQYIKFEGTTHTPFPSNMPYMQNHYLWDFSQDTHEGIHVSMSYDERWPFRMYVSPTKGGALKSGTTQFGNVLSFIGLQLWHFTYDLVYPVIITIKDEPSARNEGYAFSYAFLVSIKDNMPYKQSFGSTVFETIDRPSLEETCDYLKDSLDTEITVSTINEFKEDNPPVSGVNITYTCARYTCPLGKTKHTKTETGEGGYIFGASASLTTFFPYCVNGIIRGYKEGYEDAEKFFAADGYETYVELPMRPVMTYSNYTVVKQLYIPGNTLNPIGNSEDLFEGEEAVIMIRTPNASDQFISYPSDAPLPIKLFKDKSFTYDATIYLFNKDGDLIGGYEGEFSPDPRAVENNNFIVFHALEYPVGNEEELGLFLTGLKSYSEMISKPELIRR